MGCRCQNTTQFTLVVVGARLARLCSATALCLLRGQPCLLRGKPRPETTRPTPAGSLSRTQTLAMRSQDALHEGQPGPLVARHGGHQHFCSSRVPRLPAILQFFILTLERRFASWEANGPPTNRLIYDKSILIMSMNCERTTKTCYFLLNDIFQ